jgi:hypothetical protein
MLGLRRQSRLIWMGVGGFRTQAHQVYVLKAFGHNLMETLCLSDRIIHLHFVDAVDDVKPGFAL